MGRIILLLLVTAVFFGSCDKKKVAEGLKDAIADMDNSGKMTPVKKGGCFILVPDYMKPYKLKEGAVIEYADIYKEFYVMVTSESAHEFDSIMKESVLMETYKDSTAVGTYADIVLNASFENLDSVTDKRYSALKINGRDAREVKFHSKFNGYHLSYNVCIVQCDKNFYQVWVWHMQKDEAKYADMADKIVASFKGH